MLPEGEQLGRLDFDPCKMDLYVLRKIVAGRAKQLSRFCTRPAASPRASPQHDIPVFAPGAPNNFRKGKNKR